MRRITIKDFLTDEQIEEAKKIYLSEELPAKKIAAEVISPNLEAINEKLGHENDAMYLAYAVEYTFSRQGWKYVTDWSK